MTRVSSLFSSAFLVRFVLLVSVLAFAILSTPAHAHTLAVEGEIGATIHIDPADEPVAGSSSTIFIDFKNSMREFDPSEYAFVLTISQNSSIIATSSLFENGEKAPTASYAYTFAQPGEYAIAVVATPKDGDEPSRFTFDTHVSLASSTSKNGFFTFLGAHGGHVLITLLLIGVLVAVVGYERFKEYKIKRTVAE